MQPEAATRFAARVWAPGLERELLAICHRESRCSKRISVHARDAHHTSRAYRKAIERGWLRGWCQGPGGGWSTRGAHGLMAAYHLRYLGIPCLPAAALDVPIFSAVAAARKAARLCKTRGACTGAALRDYWHGRGWHGAACGNARYRPIPNKVCEKTHPPRAIGRDSAPPDKTVRRRHARYQPAISAALKN